MTKEKAKRSVAQFLEFKLNLNDETLTEIPENVPMAEKGRKTQIEKKNDEIVGFINI